LSRRKENSNMERISSCDTAERVIGGGEVVSFVRIGRLVQIRQLSDSITVSDSSGHVQGEMKLQ